MRAKKKKGMGVATKGMAAIALLVAGMASATAQPLTVVELFTSQGCSSCPPANANLIKLKDRPDVLALSFAVTYWDYLGWKDTFGRAEYTERQVTYEPALGRSGPFTPQMVVNGRADTVGNKLSDVEALIARDKSPSGPILSLANGKAAIGPGKAPAGGADVWLVQYRAGIVDVPVGRGENSGHTLPHANVVHALTRLGTWTGEAATLPLPKAGEGLSTAVLVQAPQGGPILAAAAN
ncbi:DUF1223 domain-containing protein [Mesorhizobium sp. UC74_2]|jgi:hypothetical protein|uniref:DUF1223 domain-containing protein n=2 Tax=unclassified Mesorhizobium TaxID=325217 RepID=UPI00366B480E